MYMVSNSSPKLAPWSAAVGSTGSGISRRARLFPSLQLSKPAVCLETLVTCSCLTKPFPLHFPSLKWKLLPYNQEGLYQPRLQRASSLPWLPQSRLGGFFARPLAHSLGPRPSGTVEGGSPVLVLVLQLRDVGGVTGKHVASGRTEPASEQDIPAALAGPLGNPGLHAWAQVAGCLVPSFRALLIKISKAIISLSA